MSDPVEYFKEHRLQAMALSVVPADGSGGVYDVRVYRLRRPGARDYSCQLTFTPEGIAIQGDITPEGNNGSCSRGKSLGWFVGENCPDHLASYFLTERWTAELAQKQLERELSELVDMEWSWKGSDREYFAERDLLQRLINGLIGSVSNEYEFYRDCEEEGYDLSEGVPGWGYCPTEVALLSAIQRTFRRLYNES